MPAMRVHNGVQESEHQLSLLYVGPADQASATPASLQGKAALPLGRTGFCPAVCSQIVASLGLSQLEA